MGKKIALEIENRIVELYNQGCPSSIIETELSVCESTVYSVLKRQGINRRRTGGPERIITEDEQYKIFELFYMGMSLANIAKTIGTSESKVSALVTSVGLRGYKQKRRRGRYLTSEGYIVLEPTKGERILEHRKVMGNILGRLLLPHETVHHKNGDRADNRPENLELRVGRHGKGATESHCHTCTCFSTDATGFP